MNDLAELSFEATGRVRSESAAVIFDRAAVRRAQLGLSYAGAVNPPEAWQLMQQDVAQLLDVRTAPEYKFVGRVPDTANVEWHGRDAAPLAAFVERLRAVAPAGRALLLICRSGVRSHAAAEAASAAGFHRVYNVLEGFEGEIDHLRQRGKINGWRRHGLPWEQD